MPRAKVDGRTGRGREETGESRPRRRVATPPSTRAIGASGVPGRAKTALPLGGPLANPPISKLK